MATLQCTVQRSSYYEVYFEYSYTQDKTNGKTNLTHSLKLKQLTNGMDFDTVADVTVSYTVAGKAFSKTGRININDKGDKGYTITLASGSSTITHNSSTGVGSFSVSVNTTIDSAGYGPGKITLSKTVDLPTIYRASVPSVNTLAGGILSEIKMSDTVYIKTNRKSSSFTHTLKYTFGPFEGVTIKTGVGDSYAWTVPDLAVYCNDVISANGTIVCTTYNGSEKVGEETCDVVFRVPDATKAVFTNGDVTIRYGNPIATNAKSANFTHLITYEFNGATGNVNDEKTRGGIVWWTPTDLAKHITSASGEGTITCITYNGDAEVGRRTTSFKAVVPNEEHFQPVVEEFALAPSKSLPPVFDGLYIQSKTGVVANFTATSDYSEMDTYKITVDGKNYAGNPATSDPFTRSGNFTVTGIVTDKRGFPTTVSKDVTVLPYRTPSLEPCAGHTSIVCERSTQDGTYDDAGTHLHIKCKIGSAPIEVEGVNKNVCDLMIQSKKSDGSWSKNTLLLEGSTAETYEAALPDYVTDADKAYTIRLTVRDKVGSTEEYEFSIPTADVTLHLGKGGHGVAVGKYSQATPDKEMFESAWDAYFEKTLYANHIAPLGLYDELDFDTLVYRTGYYAGSSAPEGVGCINAPINKTGVLDVISYMRQNSDTLNWWGFAYQTYRSCEGEVYMRSYYTGSGWTPWAKITT